MLKICGVYFGVEQHSRRVSNHVLDDLHMSHLHAIRTVHQKSDRKRLLSTLLCHPSKRIIMLMNLEKTKNKAMKQNMRQRMMLTILRGEELFPFAPTKTLLGTLFFFCSKRLSLEREDFLQLSSF